MSKHDPQELVYFPRTTTFSECWQEGFALVRNITSHVHDWLHDISPIHGAAGRIAADETETPPPPPPPPNRDIDTILGRWAWANAPAPVAKTAADDGATVSAPAEPFPTWHVSADELEKAEKAPYPQRPAPPPKPKPGAKPPADDAPPAPAPTPWAPPSHELTEEEYHALNLGPLYKHQQRYSISFGFKLPYVKRLSPDDPAVKAVLEARGSLPEIPEGKTAGTLQWTKWSALNKNPRPLYGEGWMYCEDAKSEYGRWLYKTWLQEYVSRLGSPERLPHLAALSTLSQEGAPSSLNTYDSCIMTWGVGFACGAPQIVGQLLDKPDVMNALYACGFQIKGFEPDGLLKTIPGFHYQYLDLSDPTKPKVLVWDNYHHFYGYAPSAQGAIIAVRPKVPKGAVGAVAPPGDDTHDDPLEVMKARNGKYSLQNANPMPQTNLELSYHIFNPMTVGPGKPSPVLNAFIAIARDRRTRDAVSEANRTKISERAVLTPGKAGHTALPIYTEAAYAFVSMCKHNWGLTNSQLSLEALRPFWNTGEFALIKEWRDKLAAYDIVHRPLNPAASDKEREAHQKLEAHWRDQWQFQGPQVAALEFQYEADRKTKHFRAAMTYSDALVAKAVARKVMSLLEWDRIEEARKRFLKAKAALGPNVRPPPIRLLDERLRKYSYLWRFNRLVAYWEEMNTGANWLTPIRAAVRLAGETNPELLQRIAKGDTETYRDVPRRVPTLSFSDGFDLIRRRDGVPYFGGNAYYAPLKMVYGSDDQPDLSLSTFCNLGDKGLMWLPKCIVDHGQNLDLLDVVLVEVEEEEPNPKKGKAPKMIKATKSKMTWRVRAEGNTGRQIGHEFKTDGLGEPWRYD